MVSVVTNNHIEYRLLAKYIDIKIILLDNYGTLIGLKETLHYTIILFIS